MRLFEFGIYLFREKVWCWNWKEDRRGGFFFSCCAWKGLEWDVLGFVVSGGVGLGWFWIEDI